ncbi:MAG: ABC transporter substrate-binding protein [Cryobacterium sp.]|nr:ABC transporter substrate-binding protein [Cryobacterium sp.]
MKLGKNARLLAVTTAMLVAMTGCAAEQQPADDDEPQILKIGSRNEMKSWNPSQANVNDSQQMYQTAYDTIIRRAPEGELEPMLGTSWSWDETNTELTVDLRTDVTFSDGTAFNADAVVANMENFRDGNGPQASTMRRLDTVEAVDDDTVVYRLSEPDPAFLLYLAGSAGFQASPTALADGGVDAVPVGSGPYVYDEARSMAGSSYVLVARDDYWAPELQKFDEVHLLVLSDLTARLNALLSGQVNAALLDPTVADQAEKQGKEITAYEVDWGGLFIEDRDGTIQPALGDVRVRQAINHAIDRDGMVKAVLHGRGTPTSQIFGPATAAYDPELDDYYAYDLDKARALMAEAGYADGFDVTLPTVGTLPQSLMPLLTDALGQINIRVEWVSFPGWGDYVGEVSSGKYPMPFMNQIQGDTWLEVQKLVAPTGLYNPLGTTDPEVADAIERLQTDPASFDKTAAELGRHLVEEAWFAPFYRLQLVYATSPEIDVVPQVQVSCPAIYNYSPAK